MDEITTDDREVVFDDNITLQSIDPQDIFLGSMVGRRARAGAFQAKLEAWAKSNERRFSAEVKGDTLELVVMDVIGDFFFGGVSANSIKRELDRAPNAKKIRVLVNSPGGDAFDGIAIRSLLKRHPATVTVEILGEAQSAAAILATGGDRVEMHVGSMMMIHRAWTVAVGNDGDMEAARDDLRKLDEGQVSIFTARSKQDAKKVKKWLDAETLMTAEEAIERGFADAMATEATPTESATKKRAVAAATIPEPEEVHVESVVVYPGIMGPGAVVDAVVEAEPPPTEEELEFLKSRRAQASREAEAARRAASPFLRAIGAQPPVFGGMHR